MSQYTIIYKYDKRAREPKFKITRELKFKITRHGHDEWATTRQVCRDELVVYLFFHDTQLYFYVLSTVSQKSNFASYMYIYIYCEDRKSVV